MIIKNKKTGLESHVTKEVWDAMVLSKRAMLFKVTDATDMKVSAKPVIPSEITEFKAKVSRPTKIIK